MQRLLEDERLISKRWFHQQMHWASLIVSLAVSVQSTRINLIYKMYVQRAILINVRSYASTTTRLINNATSHLLRYGSNDQHHCYDGFGIPKNQLRLPAALARQRFCCVFSL